MVSLLRSIPKELTSKWQHLRAGGAVADLLRGFANIKTWSADALDRVRAAKHQVAEEFSRLYELWHEREPHPEMLPHPVYYQVLAANGCASGAWFGLGLEGLMTAVMSMAFLALPSWIAILVGLLITILLAFFLKGCIKMSLPVAEHQPKKVLRLVAITIAALLGTVLIVLLVGFLVRGATGFLALIMGPMFSIVLSILSVLIPLIAGLLFLSAALLGWSARLAHLYEELCTLERKINELNGHVEIGRAHV